MNTKTMVIGLVVSGLVSAAMAIEPSELDGRILTLMGKLDTLEHHSGDSNSIPAETLGQAKGIILLETAKGGLIVGYQGGDGLAMVREANVKSWSAPAFVNANEATFGFQAGGEKNYYVILLMTTNPIQRLTESKMEFGADAGGIADRSSGGVGMATPSKQGITVYKDGVGLFGGAVISGGGISAAASDNLAYHGKKINMRDILFDQKAQPCSAASQLTADIGSYAKK